MRAVQQKWGGRKTAQKSRRDKKGSGGIKEHKEKKEGREEELDKWCVGQSVEAQ